MSACEKCWDEAASYQDYLRLLKARGGHPCTPEQQAGPDAGVCPHCRRRTLHQHTAEPMCGCDKDEWGEWDDYEEDGPLDLEDQLDNALERGSISADGECHG